jgi:hypothetical protein
MSKNIFFGCKGPFLLNELFSNLKLKKKKFQILKILKKHQKMI